MQPGVYTCNSVRRHGYSKTLVILQYQELSSCLTRWSDNPTRQSSKNWNQYVHIQYFH